MKTLILLALLTVSQLANSLEINYELDDCSPEAKMKRSEYAARSVLPVLRFAQAGLQLDRIFRNKEKAYENYIFRSGYVTVVVQNYLNVKPADSCLLNTISFHTILGANEPEVQSETENFYCGRLNNDDSPHDEVAPLLSIVSRKNGGGTDNYVKIYTQDGQVNYEKLEMKSTSTVSSVQESENYQLRIHLNKHSRTLSSKSDASMKASCVK